MSETSWLDKLCHVANVAGKRLQNQSEAEGNGKAAYASIEKCDFWGDRTTLGGAHYSAYVHLPNGHRFHSTDTSIEGAARKVLTQMETWFEERAGVQRNTLDAIRAALTAS